jgi:tRNA A37 methylthiotransferase MiaB
LSAEEIAPEVASARLTALQDLQRRLTLDHHISRVGSRAEIRVEGESMHGPGQVRGRDLHHRVVNVPIGEFGAPRAGSYIEVDVVEATPHSLIGTPVTG